MISVSHSPADYKYWEDQSDDYRQLEGSLLPLWKFTAPAVRRLLVSEVCWSPAHPDLLAAAYTAGDTGEPPEPGYLCLFSLKNPSVPERCLLCSCGVTCVQFHPSKDSVVVAGREDGNVFVYDARHAPEQPRVVVSRASGGKHLLGVSQVAWVTTGPGQPLSFYSVGRDGRVTHWTVHLSELEASDVLRSGDTEASEHAPPSDDRAKLQGTVTCLALKAGDANLLLMGLDSGAVVEMTLRASTNALFHYSAHSAPVRLLSWNSHHEDVFASGSADWMLKVWARSYRHPIITLDLGAPVSGLTWSHLGGSLLVGVTQDGKVHVHDLYLRKCRALCLQNVMQRRRSCLSCVAFSPFHPVLLVGGEKGYLVSFKLSPNLRRPPKEAKGADETQRREIEMARLGRLISTAPPQ
ncbi:dynein intermediate chain 2, ciliary-like [Scylla paramamosain]|uniref:dynein intermediate chain 2, ciliary-like n=1 Tax=Scylla paramamosain TaxID=85552 RepID=UPI003083BCE2